MGALMLLARADVIHGSAWDYIFPVALLALGAHFLFERRRH